MYTTHFFKKGLFIFILHVCLVCMYTHECNTLRGQKRALNPLDLELRMVVSCHVGSGNGTWVLCKNSQYPLNCWGLSLALKTPFFFWKIVLQFAFFPKVIREASSWELIKNKLSQLHIYLVYHLSIRVYVCTYLFMCVCTCTCVWSPEVNLPHLLFALLWPGSSRSTHVYPSDSRWTILYPTFTWDLRDWIQVLMLVWCCGLSVKCPPYICVVEYYFKMCHICLYCVIFV